MKNLRTLLYDAYWPPFTPEISDYDPEQAISTAVQMNANAIRMASIGKWAIYPSRIMPMHPELKGRDLLGETMNLAKSAGIKVIVYIPVGHALPFRLLSELRPQWQFYLKKDRPYSADDFYSQIHHFGGEKIVPTCLFGPYYSDIQEVVREIVTTYEPDAIYLDGPYQGWCNQDKICQCAGCREKFQKDTGLELPERATGTSEMLRTYLNWNRSKILQILKDIKEIVKTKQLPLIINRTSAMMLGTSYELKMLDEVDGFLLEAEGGGIEGISVANMLGKMVWNYTTPHNHWPRMTNPDREAKSALEGYRSIAMGATPIVSYAGRFILDQTHAAPITGLFNDMDRLSGTLQQAKFVQQACVISPSDEHYFEADDNKIFKSDKRAYSFYNAVNDAGLQTMMLPSRLLENPVNLESFELICLPSNTVITEEQADNIRKFVSRGGKLIASGAATLYSCGSQRHQNFLLADVFGANFAVPDPVTAAIMENHLWMEKPQDTYISVKDCPNLGLLPQTEYCQFAPMGTSRVIGLTVLWEKGKIEYPAIISNDFGKGKAVYINSAFEMIYDQQKNSGWRQLVKHLVRNELKIKPMVRIDAPDISWSVSRLEQSILLQIINHGGTEQNIDIEIFSPAGSEVSSLVSNQNLKIIKDDHENKIIISHINLKIYECLEIRNGK